MEPEDDEHISLEEKEHLLSELHRFFAWVGEKLPEEIDVDGEKINIHDIIWQCLNSQQSSEEDKKRFAELIRILETKEKKDEELLLKGDLTRDEARRLYHESAALIRAILDLRECEAGKMISKESGEEIRKKIDDAKRWIGFLKTVGKKDI
ncbi:MAG TPA: DUF5788 family protein [Candidatus Methanoperedens sp.]